jgi:hypothetical protein
VNTPKIYVSSIFWMNKYSFSTAFGFNLWIFHLGSFSLVLSSDIASVKTSVIVVFPTPVFPTIINPWRTW